MPKYITPDRRFEVDGAVSAVTFLKAQHGTSTPTSPRPDSPSPSSSYKHRLRELLVWDAIATHTTSSLAPHHPAPEVAYCQRGIRIDILGLPEIENHLPAADAAATLRALLLQYPRLDLKRGMTECFCALARSKPATTYDNIVGAFGEAYVEGYERLKVGETMVVDSLRPDC